MQENPNCAKCDVATDKMIATKRAEDAEKALKSACKWISNNFAECPVAYDPIYELEHHGDCTAICEDKPIDHCWMEYFKSKTVQS